jgi:hypothetical protein
MTWLRFIKFLILVVLLGLPLTSRSQQDDRDFDSGWYAGGGFSYSDVYSYTDDCWGCYGSATYGDSDNGYTITAGYRTTRYLAVEASYVDSGSMGWDQDLVLLDDPLNLYSLNATIDLTSYQINVLGIAAGRFWEGYLRAGLAMWDANKRTSLLGLHVITTANALWRSVHAIGSPLHRKLSAAKQTISL